MALTGRPGSETSRAIMLASYAGFLLVGWTGLFVPSLIRVLQVDFVRSDAEFGLVYLVIALLFAAGALSSGLIAGLVGRRVVNAAAALLIAGGMALEVAAPAWPVFLAGAGLTGAGCGAINAAVNSIVMDLAASNSGSRLSLLHLFYSVGALAAPVAIGLLVSLGIGWRLIAVATGLAGLALAQPLSRAGAVPPRPRPPEPIVELATGKITGLEALVRWLHPVRGLLLPGAFLPVAVASDLMGPLERWVLRTAIGQAIEWQRTGTLRRPQVLNINVSVRQLEAPGFLREVAADLAGSGLGPGSIAIELTETDLVRDAAQVARTIEALRRAGVRVVIDDFGTAYASMTYLADFPVDGIKIDGAFVSALDTDPGPRTRLAEAMVHMARDFGISAVAEGVETQAQATALARMGCVYAQGFLFGRPLPAGDTAELLVAGHVEAVLATPAPAPPPSDLNRGGRPSVLRLAGGQAEVPVRQAVRS